MSFADIAILLGLLGGCIYATISVTLKIFAGIHLGVDTFIAEDFLSQHNSSKQCICLYKCDFCKTVFLRPCKMLVGSFPNPEHSASEDADYKFVPNAERKPLITDFFRFIHSRLQHTESIFHHRRSAPA